MTLIPNINNQSIAILSDIEEWKKDIAAAINTKGGDSTGDESFQQLAEDIENLNDSFITYGVTVNPKINFLTYICSNNVEDRSYITEIDSNEVTEIVNSNVFKNCINLKSVSLQNLASITGGDTFNGCSSLKNINIPNLALITGGSTFNGCSSLKNINIPNLASITGGNTFHGCSSLKVLSFPKLTVFNVTNGFTNTNNLRLIILGKMTDINSTFLGTGQTYLRNITIGQDTDINLPFNSWKANNVINEGQSGIKELNDNLYNNLLTKLYDHSQDGETRTLRLGWLSYVTEENITYANAKGWTLTT